MSSSSSSSVTQPKKCNDTIVAMEKARESQDVSSASSSAPQPEKPNDITVAVDENPGQGSRREVVSERRSENPSAVPRGSENIMQRYPPKSSKIYTCNICKTGFPTIQALGGHQNAHKLEREWEKKRKAMEKEFPGFAFLNPKIDNSHLFFLGGYSEDALSNDNHLGIPDESFKRRLINGVYPYFNYGFSDMNVAVVPRMPPTHFFGGNPFTYGSYPGGFGPRPPYNTYHSMLPRNVPPFWTSNPPSGLYPQRNVLNEEDVVLKLGNDNIVVIVDDDDDDVAAGQPQEGTSKSWGADLSL
ncbi:unnamed protein product [Eruca vesicaria subsp. sativa]|uniref:C2H2-type domain-containing protein n=1 Tax=Eruca vesicaria subsp. sativa TaxID=29727 RepID=A0ABC8LF44_ERUVS|nr:unnamed protein product [Eruca vesicaria subsp. sativa]